MYALPRFVAGAGVLGGDPPTIRAARPPPNRGWPLQCRRYDGRQFNSAVKQSLQANMPRTFEDFAVFSAPAVFVVLWASGFIGAKFCLAYAEPMTFLSLRMIAVVLLLAIVIVVTRPKWPDRAGIVHSAVTGALVHGFYLGGVFASIENGLSAGLIALVVSLQPVLTSTLANRWLGERVLPRQWLGLLLGVAGVYLIVHEKIATGETTPLAWLFAIVALLGITVGTFYQKRFGGGIDWRPALSVQYASDGG